MPVESIKRFLVFFSGYILFLCIGASMFLAIEEDATVKQVEYIQKMQTDFLESNPCVSKNQFEDLISAFELANRKGLILSDNFTRWTFGQSLFFASSIITTIGYGRIIPITRGGKIFTMLYAITGLPLTISILSALVDRLLVPTTALSDWLHFKLRHKLRPFKIQFIHLTIVLTFAIIFLILIPSTIFYQLEPEWEFLDAVYFCFASITTIGFGDYTPGDTIRHFRQNARYQNIYTICSAIYAFLGVTYMMLALIVFYNIPQFNLASLYGIEEDQFSVHIQELQLHSRTIDVPPIEN